MKRPNSFSVKCGFTCRFCKKQEGDLSLERGYAIKLYDRLVHEPKLQTWILIAKDTTNENVISRPSSREIDPSNVLYCLRVDTKLKCPNCGESEILPGSLLPFIGDWDSLLPDLKKYIEG